MTKKYCAALIQILAKSDFHNRCLKDAENAGRGYAREGRHERTLCFDAWRIDLSEEVLDLLGVPDDEEFRERCRSKLLRWKMPERLEKAIYEIEAETCRFRTILN